MHLHWPQACAESARWSVIVQAVRVQGSLDKARKCMKREVGSYTRVHMSAAQCMWEMWTQMKTATIGCTASVGLTCSPLSGRTGVRLWTR